MKNDGVRYRIINSIGKRKYKDKNIKYSKEEWLGGQTHVKESRSWYMSFHGKIPSTFL